MRRLMPAVAVLCGGATLGAPADQALGAPAQLISPADRASFDRLERSLGGRSGVAVSALGLGREVQAAGTMRTAVAWSTSKVAVAMAVVARGGTTTHRSDLRSAIQASDNAAAERLWSSLGEPRAASSAATAELREAGDRRTVVQSRRLREQFTAFGQTGWRLSDQARFTAGMACLSEGRAVLDLMGGVIAAHRWGLGAALARAQLKGGWGPGSRPGVEGDYIDRQMGILTIRGKRYAVAIATAPADGTHKTGTAHLTRIAKWVVEHVDVRAIGATPRCGGAQAAQVVASAAAKPLRGTTIVLDPGHNGGNARAPSAINRPVNIGQGKTKACNTTGTATDGGYSEAAYNWDVAVRARRVLRRRGAAVVLTRNDNRSVGPCIDERARIANRAQADATVSIHADGGPASGAGFHVIEPTLIPGLTDDIFRRSHRLAIQMRAAFRAATHEPYADYIGHNGLDRRHDLGGLRLANVPAIFLETGNMRNARDAARMTRGTYRLSVARGIANGIQRFLNR